MTLAYRSPCLLETGSKKPLPGFVLLIPRQGQPLQHAAAFLNPLPSQATRPSISVGDRKQKAEVIEFPESVQKSLECTKDFKVS